MPDILVKYERFGWDPDKRDSNLRMHGIDFRRAAEIFDDACMHLPAQTIEGEVRFKAIGQLDDAIIAVIYTDREKGRVCRIISARRASRNERRQYQDFRENRPPEKK